MMWIVRWDSNITLEETRKLTVYIYSRRSSLRLLFLASFHGEQKSPLVNEGAQLEAFL